MAYTPPRRLMGVVLARGAMAPIAPSGDAASGESGTSLTREQIRTFQTKLIDLGFTNDGRVVADGVFGDNIRAAVRAFQAARSLPSSGTFNAATRAALDASPGRALLWPDQGTVPQIDLARRPGASAFFQQVLTALGATANGRLRIDGAIGPVTESAVREFQQWWSPENLRRANSSPNADDQARWRSALARVAGGRLAVDGNLGPDTQRLLIWLAFPRDRGGGGEAEEYATFAPANSVRPYILELLPGDRWTLRDPDTTAPPPVQSNAGDGGTPRRQGNVANLLQEIGVANQNTTTLGDFGRAAMLAESVRRARGRRTVVLSGLNPQLGARVFVDGVDVTSTAEENGQGARWAGDVWRMGVPDTARTMRVVAPDRAEATVTLPVPPPVASPSDDPSVASVAANIVQRTVRVNIPAVGAPTTEQGGVVQTQSRTEDPVAVTRIPGRRTVLINGLNPQHATRVFADGVDVTLTPEESGQAARWEGGAWRMGVPDTTRVLRVTNANGLDFSVNLPPAAPVTADAVNNIAQRSVRVDAPVAPVAPTQAGMGGIVWVGAAAAILAGVYFSQQKSSGSKR